MTKRLSALLEDVLASAQLVRTYLEGLSKDDFLASTQSRMRYCGASSSLVRESKTFRRRGESATPKFRGAPSLECVTCSSTATSASTHDIPLLEGQVAQLLDEVRQDEARTQASAGADDGLP